MDGLYCVFLYFIIYLQVLCADSVIDESKNPLPYFRRQVEEIIDDTTALSSESGSTTNSNLVSLLIKHVKKIFNDLDDSEHPEITTPISTKDAFVGNTTSESNTELFSENWETLLKNKIIQTSPAYELVDTTLPFLANFASTKLVHLVDKMIQHNTAPIANDSGQNFKDVESTTALGLVEKEELMHLSKNLYIFETDRRERDNINYFSHNASYFPSGNDISLRSCIFCDNIMLENCNDPKNRLIPSTVCELNDDVCYSMHTPFGVIDRGCFNVNHNLTTYVCSCNLCNYISISEMPYIFATPQDWVDNVIELSRTKHLRKSVFKDMSCLKCESNATAKTGDMLDTANCLEGNIASLPTEQCEEDEVCAVRAIKQDGYLWRGCVKEPLFNYWWGFCDSDLCNYDVINSIYDSV